MIDMEFSRHLTIFNCCSMSHHMLVRVKGLEPPLPYGKQILSLPRLPFRHTRAPLIDDRPDYNRGP
jgi:hypothetical protein